LCLIVFAYKLHPQYELIFAANRDEFYERPTADASFWDECPGVLAGKDLQNKGTWLGITRQGRLAAVTNYRDPSLLKSETRSRGLIVSEFLCGDDAPRDYLIELDNSPYTYDPFNVLIGDRQSIWYYSNVNGDKRELPPGLYGLSNNLLDVPWPKVSRAKEALGALLQEPEVDMEKVMGIMADTTPAPDHELPDTGVGLSQERMLSPIFIVSPIYGTRSTTVITIDYSRQVHFVERNFTAEAKESWDVEYGFKLESSG